MAAGLELYEQPIGSVEPGRVRLADGTEVAVDAFHVVAPMRPRDNLAAALGLETQDLPWGQGIAKADSWGATSVLGIFGAGDIAGGGNVAAAIAAGSLAATALHRSLVFGFSSS